MEYRKITISQLDEFVRSGEYLKYGTIPITSLRAVSQLNNPRALPDDVVLTLAITEEKTLAGFIGALPDRTREVRCAWNSCWWVSKGTPAEVSMKLFYSFLKDWNGNVLFSELTPHTSFLIEKLRFCNHKVIIGFRGYSRFCMADILPLKRSLFSKVKILLYYLDFILNILIDLMPASAKAACRLRANEIEYPTKVHDDFLIKYSHKLPIVRLSEDFKWIKENQWVSDEKQVIESQTRSYPFSLNVTRFEMHWVEFHSGDEMVALVCYTIRDKELKLAYVNVREGYVSAVGDYFYKKVRLDRGLCMITTFHAGLAHYFTRNKKFIYTTHLPKFTAISKQLIKENKLDEFDMQMGDGDCIFT